jgi:alpha-tubulin suppressor-like RCC1 family protein
VGPVPVTQAAADLWSWGANPDGQLANGTRESPVLAELTDPFASLPIRQLAAGDSHSVALVEYGVFVWGDGSYGQLGIWDTEPGELPRMVPPFSTSPVIQVAAGGFHTLALTEDGTVWAWGANEHGQVGDGGMRTRWLPTPVIRDDGAPLRAIVHIAAGSFHSVAVDAAGRVWSWGANGWGQLGTGDWNDRLGAVMVSDATMAGIPARVTRVAAGGAHTLALDRSCRVWAWGAGEQGQLGDGGTVSRATPVMVTVPAFGSRLALGPVVQIVAGLSHSLALLNDCDPTQPTPGRPRPPSCARAGGHIAAWGSNNQGQLGTKAVQAACVAISDDADLSFSGGPCNPNPARVQLEDSPDDTHPACCFVAVSAGNGWSLGATMEDTLPSPEAPLYAWGINAYGLLSTTVPIGGGHTGGSPYTMVPVYEESGGFLPRGGFLSIGPSARHVLAARSPIVPPPDYRSPYLEPIQPATELLDSAGRLDCADFASQAAAQAVLRMDPGDPNLLDADRDGIACEANPAPRDLEPVRR